MLHQTTSSFGSRVKPALLVCGAAALLLGTNVTTAAATPLFSLYNTGIDPGIMMGVDNHYTVSVESPALPLSSNVTYETNISNLPYSPADNSTSAFIAPQPTYTGGQVDEGGTFDFSTSFTIPAGNVSTAFIEGRFESDDYISAILVNGVSIGTLGPISYKQFSPYYTLSGPGLLVAGTNTLTFEVYNFAGTNTDPVALRTEFIAAVPEPSTWAALVGVASVALAGSWLRRRRATV